MNKKERKKTWAEKVAIVKDSYNRSRNKEHFATLFYDNLFFLKPKLKDYFKDTNFEHQKKAIMFGLDYLISFLDGAEGHSRQQVLRIARTHSVNNMNIHPHDYYYWIEALILTTKECDYHWHNDLAFYWRECLSFPISFIISQYYQKDHD
jgi:hemoglobin-like flavoprotein